MKEKKMVDIKNPTYSYNKTGRAMAKGVCGNCGTKINRILGSKDITPEVQKKLGPPPKKTGGARSRRSGRRSGKRSRSGGRSGGRSSGHNSRSRSGRRSRNSRNSRY